MGLLRWVGVGESLWDILSRVCGLERNGMDGWLGSHALRFSFSSLPLGLSLFMFSHSPIIIHGLHFSSCSNCLPEFQFSSWWVTSGKGPWTRGRLPFWVLHRFPNTRPRMMSLFWNFLQLASSVAFGFVISQLSVSDSLSRTWFLSPKDDLLSACYLTGPFFSGFISSAT